MAEKEILESLAVCADYNGSCLLCSYHALLSSNCLCLLQKDIIKLINQKNAQIDHLTAENERLNNFIHDLMKE